ncbi:MAG: ImmA/IrrE family metallo-endopeptidase [Spirochaetales bacterium]|nr:ImmA/IrrE family metallo-endopeptidase [Spirochaetales bacterium]
MNTLLPADCKKDIEERVNEILIRSSTVKSFPFRCSTLIKELGSEVAIKIMPFSWIEEQGMNAEDVVHSKDAGTVESQGRYIIFYNQKMPPSRLAFSVAHELGHIILGHDMEKITQYIETKDPRLEALYKRYEAEANYFAACLLMPEVVINRLKSLGCHITKEFLQAEFNVSELAAEIRIETVNRNSRRYVSYWEKDKSLDNALLLKFNDFIRKVSPRKKTYEEEYEYEERMQEERNRWIAEGY